MSAIIALISITFGPPLLVYVVLLITKLFDKRPPCPKCGSKDRRHSEYTRAYNDLCKQAAGEWGYYCMNCMHIEFETPSFNKWLADQPRWIVRKRGDPWRPLP